MDFRSIFVTLKVRYSIREVIQGQNKKNEERLIGIIYKENVCSCKVTVEQLSTYIEHSLVSL